MLCAVCSNCVRMPFTSLTEAYATGCLSCAPAAAGASRAVNTAMKQKSDRTRIFCEFAMRLRIVCSVFANHILFDVDHPSRVGAAGRFRDEHAKTLNHQAHEVSRRLWSQAFLVYLRGVTRV